MPTFATHNACGGCYSSLRPGVDPIRIKDGTKHQCCYCHRTNDNGIFIRDSDEMTNCKHAGDVEPIGQAAR